MENRQSIYKQPHPTQEKNECIISTIIETVKNLAKQIDLEQASTLSIISSLVSQINSNYKKQSKGSTMKVELPARVSLNVVDCL